ncbi:MAG TPA: response regulator [Chitinophagaceae bacterium]|nr:response regulator [Chitinophagaceae bacterium]
MKVKGLECILLVDDDEATNFVNSYTIKKTGLEVHVQLAADARQALDYLTCKGEYSRLDKYPQPGIVFLDINMPGMSGWDFLKEYQILPVEQKAHIVIAMLTTSLNPDDREKGEQNTDIKKFITKPLTAEMLAEVIRANFPQE